MPDAPISAAESAGRVCFLAVGPEQDGQRIDNFLLSRLKGVPKSRIYRMLRTGEVRVDGGRIKADRRLKAGETVRVPPLRLAAAVEAPVLPAALCADIEARILLERPGFLVINKPAGLAVHGGSGLAFGLIETLRRLRPGESLELVHRLDRDTSGCLLVARSRRCLLDLHAQLREQRMDKRYQALVQGRWPAHRRSVSAPLEKNQLQSGERMVRVGVEGKAAVTEFRVLRRFAQATLVEAVPMTGRTHQIRVHARHAGHPIAGDPKYGDDAFNAAMKTLGLRRLFLHAASLAFRDPASGEACCVEAVLDSALQQLLERLDA